MQTKFKWTEKQRLKMIDSLGMGVLMSPSLEVSHKIGEYIIIFTKASSDFINDDEYVQERLKTIFKFQKALNVTELHDTLVKLESDDESSSFAA